MRLPERQSQGHKTKGCLKPALPTLRSGMLCDPYRVLRNPYAALRVLVSPNSIEHLGRVPGGMDEAPRRTFRNPGSIFCCFFIVVDQLRRQTDTVLNVFEI